jgi:hypothetical protein
MRANIADKSKSARAGSAKPGVARSPERGLQLLRNKRQHLTSAAAVHAEIVDKAGSMPLVCGVPTGWLSRE